MTRSCTSCGAVNRAEARFCDSCGSALAATGEFASELKFVTVMFADVVDSTSLIAERSPEEAREVLRPAVDALAAAVGEFGGTVHSVLGDGVMALFGAPTAQEDHAVRSCRAALQIHEAAPALAIPVRYRIGLASGPALLSRRGNLPATGATIHLASRLQAIARPGTTLCSEATHGLADASVTMTALGEQALRGFGTKLRVYALTGARSGRDGFGGAPRRALSPFLGRERELTALRDLAAEADATALAVVTGEPGVGKSRLAWEASCWLEAQNWTRVRVAAPSYGQALPYHLLATLLQAIVGMEGRDEAGTARLEAWLADAGLPASVRAPLRSLLSLPLGEDGPAWDAMDPFRRSDAIAEAMVAVQEALAARPTVLLLDDLQWADEESLKALDRLVRGERKSLILVTHRPDFRLPWTRPAALRIDLERLDDKIMLALLERAFPTMAAETQAALVARAEGNPFFLEELAREALRLRDEATGVRTELPPTIQTVVTSRLDRLSAEGKRMAMTAAALGTQFPRRQLSAVFAEVGPERFQHRLGELASAGLLLPVPPGAPDVAFSHALVQEVCYAVLPQAEQRALHAVIARALTASGAETPERAEEIVYHAARGQAWPELIDAAGSAARRASRRSAYAAAIRFFRQGIEAFQRVPRTPARMAAEIDLRFELRVALYPTDGIKDSLENSIEAERLARLLGDSGRLGWATAYLARDLQLVGRPREAVAMAAQARALAAEDPKLLQATRYFAAQAGYSMGRYGDVAAELRDLIQTLEEREPGAWTGTTGPAVVIFRVWLIWSLSRLGRFDEALAEASRMHALADEHDLPLGRTLAHLSEGFALAHTDRLQEAEAALRTALEFCRRWELLAWSTNILSCLGHVRARRGAAAEGVGLIEDAAGRTREIGVLVNHAHELCWLADALLRAGSPDRGRAVAEEALDVARRHEERGNEALAEYTLAQIWRALGEPGAAQACFAAASAIAEGLGMAPLVAECTSGLSELIQV